MLKNKLGKNKISVILSLLSAICFFLVYFIRGGVINLVLGFAWICISIGMCYKEK